ncbi:hypothetical protein F5X99DRAFT_388490 [Biscogniauxia marginata]|nr:hypothetical protein F5X99DRAFT_388490 [Biscogniauxia marginata]
MGFTTGFTGGVTLTLSIAYLSILAHQRSREYQASVLRQQTRTLSAIVDPLPPVLPPTRAELAAAERANLIESAKDRWNAEVEGAVRWAQTKDWVEVREGVEIALGRLWSRAISDDARKGADTAQTAAGIEADSVGALAKSAYSNAKARGSNAVDKAEEKAEEARSSVFGAIGRVFEKAKSAVGITRDKAESKLDEKMTSNSPVEKALSQRYQQPNSKEQSVDDTLAARYAPVDKKDNTKLKTV